MKKLILSLVAALIAMACFSQNTLVATLTHGDEISMFYGSSAFKQAHEAAADGDIINLSGGAFESTDITKGITVRGAGVESEFPTEFERKFDIEIPTTVSDRLSFEGIIINSFQIYNSYAILADVCFTKCKISNVEVRSKANLQFFNCQIPYYYCINENSSSFFLGCCIGYLSVSGNSNLSNNAALVNCLININYSNYINKNWGFTNMSNCYLSNCILVARKENYDTSLPSSAIAHNCLAFNDINCFSKLSDNTNCTVYENSSEILKDFFIDSDVMKDLTEEAKAKYLGDDGTPIGMYGGSMPFNLTPSYPLITKMNVASRTTADGKLSVEIEVNVAE